MWLSSGEASQLLARHGIAVAGGRAPSADDGGLRVRLEIEPRSASIALSASRGGRSAGPLLLDPVEKLWDYQARRLLRPLDLLGDARALVPALRGLRAAFSEAEALVLEARVAADATASDVRVLLDVNARTRNPLAAAAWQARSRSPATALKALGIDYLPLQGDIGLISVGAGETMAAMDLIAREGGRPACFLDCSGGFTFEAIHAALRQVIATPGVRSILVNVFGGVTRVDAVAESLLAALTALGGLAQPLVVRLEGTNAERGRALVAQAGYQCQPSLREAVEAAVGRARDVAVGGSGALAGERAE